MINKYSNGSKNERQAHRHSNFQSCGVARFDLRVLQPGEERRERKDNQNKRQLHFHPGRNNKGNAAGPKHHGNAIGAVGDFFAVHLLTQSHVGIVGRRKETECCERDQQQRLVRSAA